MRQDLDLYETHGAVTGRLPDLVFDFAGMRSPDLGALCLVFTARNLAVEDNRRVWLHALPEPTWRLLHALGLEDFFELMPHSGELVN